MKIVFLTPGTGSYYCGACMRDSTLARELHRAGHDTTVAPMYLPLVLEEPIPTVERAPIFFGGINVYLQQKLPLFRQTPAAIDRLLNAPGLLRWAARHSHMTSAREHGEMTLEMLNLEQSRFGKEWEKLARWLAEEKPDLVCLSNALLAGFIPALQQRLRVPVVTFFQGEDSFLDGLPEPYRTQCWTALAGRLGGADALLAPSRFYADFMRERLGLAAGAIEVVPNGIRLEDYPSRAGSPDPAAAGTTVGSGEPALQPTIGYLARMNRDKGLQVLIEAFVFLAQRLGDSTTQLRIAGALTAGDEPFVREMQQRVAAAGLASRVRWTPNLTREAKVELLRRLTVFSVPAVYAEAFGLYVIEAMACGVPVVQPAASAFPELIDATGGGICVAPRNPEALARGWQQLLGDPAGRATLGRNARLGVEKHFSAGTMAAQFSRVAERVVGQVSAVPVGGAETRPAARAR